MLSLVIISVLININGAFDFPDPRDLVGHVSDAFDQACNTLENIIDTIPDLPILGKYIELTQCGIAAGNSLLNPGVTLVNDATITIKNRISEIEKCSSSIINSVKVIISDNNKDAYFDLAKGFFTECSGLNAGAITIEYGGGAALIAGISSACGLIIDASNGDIYSYIAGCFGITSDITASGGYTLSLFDSLNDVAGCSKYYSIGFDINIAGIEGGMDLVAVYNLPSDSIIARGIGYGMGVGGNPQNVENGYCYTFDPIKMVNINEFNKDNILTTIPALSTYVPRTAGISHGQQVIFSCGEWYEYIYHDNYRLYCGQNNDKYRTTFIVRNALNDNQGQFSFESVELQNHYIRHQNDAFYIHAGSNDAGYKDDASFKIYNSLNNEDGKYSFEASNDNYQYHFMRAAKSGAGAGGIWLNIWEDSFEYKPEISFIINVQAINLLPPTFS